MGSCDSASQRVDGTGSPSSQVGIAGLLLPCRPAFSERGCQEKHSPADRPPGRNSSRGSQPLLRRDDLLIRPRRVSTLHGNVVFSSETEKQAAALIANHSSL